MKGASRLEHCPSCNGTNMKNYVHIEPGSDVEVFVECADCNTFVARYTLKMYTGDDPYESYLRLMHKRRMSSGASTRNAISVFTDELMEGYRRVKEEVAKNEDPRSIEEILSEM